MYTCTGAMWHVIHWKMCGQLKMYCYAPQQNVVVLKYVIYSGVFIQGAQGYKVERKGDAVCTSPVSKGISFT